MKAVKSEQVLVVPREQLFSDGVWHGLLSDTTAIKKYIDAIASNARYVSRSEVEDDPEFQQIIPYAVYRSGNRYLLTKRLKKSSERRLHKLYSLGLGGHINPEDGLPEDCIMRALMRELEEEIEWQGHLSIKLIGLLKDDSSPVSKVHLGIVYLLDGEDSDVKIREVDKMEGWLTELNNMLVHYMEMESWSQIIYDYLVDSPVLPA